MKQLPEGVTGRILALAIAVLGVAMFYFALISPVLDFYSEREDLLDSRVAMAARYETLTRELPALRAADKKWLDQAGGELLLDGSSDAIASASLQGVMKGLVEDAGAKLSSSEVLPPSANGSFRRVGVRVTFSGDLKLVTAVLRQMETSRPVLSVGDFSLHSGSSAAGGEESDEENEAPVGNGDSLAVTLDVYGFRAA